MRRRDLFVGLGSTLLASNVRAFAQSANRRWFVGVLISASPPHPLVDSLRQGLRDLGYEEGRNIALEVRYTEGRSDRATTLAAEMVHLGVDVIVAHFTPAVKAAIAATQTIPIVMAPAGAPLQLGFVQSLAQPGGNVTGLSGMDAEIGGKRLQLLRELIPTLRCVGVLASTPSTDPYSIPYVEDLRSAAMRVNVRLEPILVSGPKEFDDAFAAMAKAGAQAVIIQGLFDPHRKLLVQLASKYRLAYMSHERETAAVGAVISISADYLALYEQVALFVDKIIKGAKPGALSIWQPTKFWVAVNANSARGLGLSLSPQLLAHADEVIE